VFKTWLAHHTYTQTQGQNHTYAHIHGVTSALLGSRELIVHVYPVIYLRCAQAIQANREYYKLCTEDNAVADAAEVIQ